MRVTQKDSIVWGDANCFRFWIDSVSFIIFKKSSKTTCKHTKNFKAVHENIGCNALQQYKKENQKQRFCGSVAWVLIWTVASALRSRKLTLTLGESRLIPAAGTLALRMSKTSFKSFVSASVPALSLKPGIFSCLYTFKPITTLQVKSCKGRKQPSCANDSLNGNLKIKVSTLLNMKWEPVCGTDRKFF